MNITLQPTTYGTYTATRTADRGQRKLVALAELSPDKKNSTLWRLGVTSHWEGDIGLGNLSTEELAEMEDIRGQLEDDVRQHLLSEGWHEVDDGSDGWGWEKRG